MKRFVEVRGTDPSVHPGQDLAFAFWDTVVDQFETFDGVQVFRSLSEFQEFACDQADINRYLALIPAEWGFPLDGD